MNVRTAVDSCKQRNNHFGKTVIPPIPLKSSVGYANRLLRFFFVLCFCVTVENYLIKVKRSFSLLIVERQRFQEIQRSTRTASDIRERHGNATKTRRKKKRETKSERISLSTVASVSLSLTENINKFCFLLFCPSSSHLIRSHTHKRKQ